MRASTLRPTAALPTARRARRRAAAPRAPRAESNFDEPSGPQPAAVILGVGIGMMVNASSFLCAYRVSGSGGRRGRRKTKRGMPQWGRAERARATATKTTRRPFLSFHDTQVMPEMRLLAGILEEVQAPGE